MSQIRRMFMMIMATYNRRMHRATYLESAEALMRHLQLEDDEFENAAFHDFAPQLIQDRLQCHEMVRKLRDARNECMAVA